MTGNEDAMTSVDRQPGPARGRYGALVVFLGLTLGVGTLGSIATASNVATWYAALTQPSFAPPNWIFAPVWTTLYIFMAVAAWRVWCISRTRSRPLALFAAQLVLNCAWSFIFFAAHRIGAALAELVVLLALVAWTTLSFGRIDRMAGWLFVPYLAWSIFATVLNAEIWRLN
jgi:tryptophan-rich sensory protein